MSEQERGVPQIRINISPEPTDEEAAAIAAVVAALSARAGDSEPESRQQTGRWALAGRHEGMRRPLWPVDGDQQW